MRAKTETDSDDPRVVLETAYGKYGDDLYRYALMILTDHSAAEDAVQTAFMKTLKLGKRMLQIASLSDYLRIAVRNTCYAMIKKQRRLDNELKTKRVRPILEKLDEGSNEDERASIEQALCTLPVEQREVLHMKIYEGKTFEEIARMVGIPADTAASRYRYALGKLRQILGSEYQREDNRHES
ncbi:MAG TPA: sigma-70 family RNA polymerase sigma factor [Sedimentisphaerales bacterium]|nr:sigma-70 family RNA polymerase sigma factor [Sedimentisphaerales bacterium]